MENIPWTSKNPIGLEQSERNSPVNHTKNDGTREEIALEREPSAGRYILSSAIEEIISTYNLRPRFLLQNIPPGSIVLVKPHNNSMTVYGAHENGPLPTIQVLHQVGGHLKLSPPIKATTAKHDLLLGQVPIKGELIKYLSLPKLLLGIKRSGNSDANSSSSKKLRLTDAPVKPNGAVHHPMVRIPVESKNQKVEPLNERNPQFPGVEKAPTVAQNHEEATTRDQKPTDRLKHSEAFERCMHENLQGVLRFSSLIMKRETQKLLREKSGEEEEASGSFNRLSAAANLEKPPVTRQFIKDHVKFQQALHPGSRNTFISVKNIDKLDRKDYWVTNSNPSDTQSRVHCVEMVKNSTQNRVGSPSRRPNTVNHTENAVKNVDGNPVDEKYLKELLKNTAHTYCEALGVSAEFLTDYMKSFNSK